MCKGIIGYFTRTLLLAGIFFFGLVPKLPAQELYHDHEERSSLVHYQTVKGSKFDSSAANPLPDEVNTSLRCAQYKRSRQKYDNIKVHAKGKLYDVTPYLSSAADAPRLRMKIFTTAPAGTLVELQLCKKGLIPYPDGVNSQFQARTTVSGQWEELVFEYKYSPEGSKTGPRDIDHLALLFNPNTNTTDIYYFDDLTGPTIVQQQAARFWKRREARKN